jgi:thymidylate synthase ThyX
VVIINKYNIRRIMITKFNTIIDDWKRVKNHCRTTDNKDFTDNEATDTFKKKLLISEHSPIRLLEFDWSWKGIKYWVSQELARHRFEKFISSQRDDRLKDEIPRGQKPQDALVNFDGYANMQNLIDAWRKRLCYQATKEARELAEDFKIELHKTHPIESNVLVPNCIYRGSCCEFNPCGYWNMFLVYCSNHDLEIGKLTIQERYDAYNNMFYEMRGGNQC